MFADNNLFNPAWTTGNLSAIAPIVSVVGFVCMCLISIGGLFMALLPIMRLVINGIVVVAPNLCDKIDEAHRQKLGFNSTQGGNQIVMIMGSVSTIVLSCFPNFKAMSDFDKGIVDPKSFMIKAIPMMCVAVFIGAFTFYGYPSKIAEKFVGAGTGVIDVIINNVDPEAWIEKIPTNLARPDFSTSSATDVIGKNTNKLAKAVYEATVSKYNVMSKDNKIEVSRAIEQWVANDILSPISIHSDSSKFKMTVEARIMEYKPELNPKAMFPSAAYDAINFIYVYQTTTTMDKFGIDVPGGVDGHYVQINLKFIETTDSGSGINKVDVNVTNGGKITGGDNNTVVWTTPAGISANGSVTVNGVTGVGTTKSASGKTIYVVTFKNAKPEDIRSGTGECSNIFALDQKGGTHPIKKISFGEGQVSFNPVDSSRYTSWTAGGSPEIVKADQGTTPKP